MALVSRSFGFLPALFALEQGFYAAEGLAVEQPVMEASTALAGITGGSVTFAIAGSGVRAAYEGLPVKALMYYFNRSTWIGMSGPAINSIAELKGKKVGIGPPGDEKHVVTRNLLKSGGLTEADVTIISAGNDNERAAALLAGQIDFTIVNTNQVPVLEAAGNKVIARAADVHPVPFTGFVASDDLVKNNPDLIKAWLRANIKAMLHMSENPEEVVDFAVRETGMNRADAQRAVELTLPYINKEDPGGASSYGILLATQVNFDALGLSRDVDEWAAKTHDFTLLREVQAELGIQCPATGYQCK